MTLAIYYTSRGACRSVTCHTAGAANQVLKLVSAAKESEIRRPPAGDGRDIRIVYCAGDGSRSVDGDVGNCVIAIRVDYLNF